MQETNQNEATQVDALSFREAMAQLEEVVRMLESGTLELEDSLVQYARGVELLASLRNRLNGAEQQINVLMGQLSAAPEDSVQDTTLLKA